MKKNVLVFGVIAGLIVSTFMAVSMMKFSQAENPDMSGGMIIGFASMAVAFSFIFVGIKNYRDKQNEGVITFGKAFLMGCLISLVASTMYVVTWAIEFHFFLPEFAQNYASSQVKMIEQSKMSVQEMETAIKKVTDDMKLYASNPFYFTMYTYLEIFPVGLVVTLISALILKRKTKKDSLTD
ncbi:DUF4199 domain-containing protein [Aurantibacillus circumpalustris]|uniref:DUF4199 domain-containing protein n=1 Tax=Aurantibacillus circumpalustris TaxID=3036359 RepID=UPI00295AF4CB|nr:DUF4199 domain-containing protein [Aurantibacillus circumpalustris]